jgi:hypothetical protein
MPAQELESFLTDPSNGITAVLENHPLGQNRNILTPAAKRRYRDPQQVWQYPCRLTGPNRQPRRLTVVADARLLFDLDHVTLDVLGALAKTVSCLCRRRRQGPEESDGSNQRKRFFELHVSCSPFMFSPATRWKCTHMPPLSTAPKKLIRGALQANPRLD